MSKVVGAILVMLRFLLGAMGAVWVLVGAERAIEAGSDGAWAAAVGGLAVALFGLAVAYGAFVAFPWERAGTRSPQ